MNQTNKTNKYRDPAHGRQFNYCRLQSRTGQRLLQEWNLPTTVSAVVLIDEEAGQSWMASEAVFRILAQLNAPWYLFSYFGILPRFLTDFGYHIVGSMRYKFFGKKDPNEACTHVPGLRKLTLDWKEPLVISENPEISNDNIETVKDV